MIDTSIAEEKGNLGKDKLDNILDYLRNFDSKRTEAFNEINRHSELDSVNNVSIKSQLDELYDYVDKYKKFGGGFFSSSFASEYKDEVDKVFENDQRKVLNALTDIKLEDIQVVCTIGSKSSVKMDIGDMLNYLYDNYSDDKIKTLVVGSSNITGIKTDDISIWAKIGKGAKSILFDIGCGAILCISGAIIALFTAETGIGVVGGVCMVASGANSVANGFTDIVHMFKGEWNDVGNTNYMKQGFEAAGEKVSDMLNADRGIGKAIGDICNFAVDAGAMLGGVVSAAKGLPSLAKNFSSCKVYYIENILLEPVYERTIRSMPIPVALYKVYDTIGNKFSADAIYQDFKEAVGLDSSTTILDDVQSSADKIYEFFTGSKASPEAAN